MSYASSRFDQHLRNLGREESKTNSYFAASTKLIRTFLVQVELALNEAGVDAQTSTVVINKLIWGSISPGELARVESDEIQMRQRFEELSGLALPTRVGESLFNHPLDPFGPHPGGDPRDEKTGPASDDGS